MPMQILPLASFLVICDSLAFELIYTLQAVSVAAQEQVVVLNLPCYKDEKEEECDGSYYDEFISWSPNGEN